MFQYAMLLGVADKLKTNVKIPKHNSFITKEDGCLDLYTNKWIPYRFILNECFDMKIEWMLDHDFTVIKNISKELFFHFDDNVFKSEDNTNFDGYFQSYKYFEHIIPEIKKTFEFKSSIQKSALSEINWLTDIETVSIHVRRGDYLGIPDILPVCETEYFQKSLSYFTDKEYRFIVFSDDMPWCKETFGDDNNIFYSVSTNPANDMFLMSLCQHHIISNSTFSLWGALLSNNKNKRVIAPKQWFGQALKNNNTNDLIPKDWIRI